MFNAVAGDKKSRGSALDEMLKDLDFPEERMKLIITVGKPADQLLKFAVKEDVDMIVMGVKAKSEIVHAFTGSVAEKLFRRSPITIVSYREESIAGKLRKRITEYFCYRGVCSINGSSSRLVVGLHLTKTGRKRVLLVLLRRKFHNAVIPEIYNVDISCIIISCVRG
jgi:K+-sensing histidine kinase KdpD